MVYRHLNLLLWCCLAAGMTLAGKGSANDAPRLPTDPTVWVNSPPISLEQLKGKAVFFWFFEETCPKCRAEWPMLIEKSRQMSDRPIVFIAVNSGNDPANVQGYADAVRVTWPIIVDVDRSLEKACDVGEINLQNVMQCSYVTADGALEMGEWDKIDETIKEALEGASWKVDPSEVPDALKETWRGIEFGNYKGTGAALKKFLASPKKDLAEAARTLQGVVKKSITEELEAAKTENEANHHWRAFEICQKISDRYNGFEAPAELADLKKSLQKEADVKTGTAGRKAVETALKGLNTGRPISKKIKAQLEKIINDFSDSDLARDAQRVIDKAAEAKPPKDVEGSL